MSSVLQEAGLSIQLCMTTCVWLPETMSRVTDIETFVMLTFTISS